MDGPAVVLVSGTWGWRDGFQTAGQWWQDGPFVRLLESAGIEVLSKARPFIWTTAVDGFPALPHSHRHLHWEAAGANLYAYLDPAIPDYGLRLPPDHRRVICHSHGLQVCLYAAANGCEIDLLVSVCSPVRADMMAVAREARPRIRRWLHIASDWTDRMQWFGELFDGGFGIRRCHASADRCDRVEGVGHSGLLRDPKHYGVWDSRGWLSILRNPDLLLAGADAPINMSPRVPPVRPEGL